VLERTFSGAISDAQGEVEVGEFGLLDFVDGRSGAVSGELDLLDYCVTVRLVIDESRTSLTAYLDLELKLEADQKWH